MAMKKNGEKIEVPNRRNDFNVEKTKSKVSQVWNQARESLKLLETLEKETFAKARTFVKNPLPANRKRLTNEKILASLQTLGVASRAEIKALEAKVDLLQSELTALHALVAQTSGGAKRAKTAGARTQPQADAFPNT
jgi:hypothetical protein